MNKEQSINFSRENFNNPTRELKAKNIEIETLKTRISVIEAENTSLKEENSKLQEKIYINPVSGLPNRNAFEDCLKDLYEKEIDLNMIGFVFFDVNNLKETNDTLGHIAGDNLIKEVGEYIKSIFRETDLIFHFGGDEYLTICLNSRHDDYCDGFNFKTGLPVAVRNKTASNTKIAVGAATFDPSIDSNLMDTLHRADLAMLEHKKETKLSRRTYPY